MPAIYIALAATLACIAGIINAHAYLRAYDAFQSYTLSGAFLSLQTSFGLYVSAVTFDFAALFLASRARYFSPEVLALLLLTSTCVTIALTSGRWMVWETHKQLLSVLLVLGVGYLSYTEPRPVPLP